jgi:site-specific recombinase XerC
VILANASTPLSLKNLFASCRGKDFISLRDTAIIRVLFDTGARLSEVANLTLDDVDLDLRMIQVLGKGRRARTTPSARRPYGPALNIATRTADTCGSACGGSSPTRASNRRSSTRRAQRMTRQRNPGTGSSMKMRRVDRRSHGLQVGRDQS